MAHKEEVKVVEEQPKRLKMKDAGIQKNEDKPSSIKGVQTDNEDEEGLRRHRGYKSTDVSTTTEVTPLKSRRV